MDRRLFLSGSALCLGSMVFGGSALAQPFGASRDVQAPFSYEASRRVRRIIRRMAQGNSGATCELYSELDSDGSIRAGFASLDTPPSEPLFARPRAQQIVSTQWGGVVSKNPVVLTDLLVFGGEDFAVPAVIAFVTAGLAMGMRREAMMSAMDSFSQGRISLEIVETSNGGASVTGRMTRTGQGQVSVQCSIPRSAGGGERRNKSDGRKILRIQSRDGAAAGAIAGAVIGALAGAAAGGPIGAAAGAVIGAAVGGAGGAVVASEGGEGGDVCEEGGERD